MRNPFLVVLLVSSLLACNLLTHLTEATEIYPLPTSENTTVSVPTETGIGETFYVSTNGDDKNPGSQDRPWASPGYASRQLNPGDTLIILGGKYLLNEYDADILIPPSGTSNAWITIRGEQGNRPILEGGNDLATAIDLSGVQYMQLENLEITHNDQAHGEAAWFRDGIEIMSEPSAHIILKDLYIHHIDEFGLNFQDVEDLQIIDCRIEYTGFGAVGGPEGESGGWQNVVIQKSRLSYGGHYYQGGDGSDRPYDRPDGFGIEPSRGPILIENTIAEHNFGDGLDSKAENTTISRSIVANNSCDGVKLWGDNSRVENTLIYGRGDGVSEITLWSPIVIHTEIQNARFELVNVTVDDALGQNYLMHVQYDYPDTPLNLTIRNSIFRGVGQSSPLFIGERTTLTAENNLFYLPQSDSIMEYGQITYAISNLDSLGAGNLYGDPLFLSPTWGGQGDYHLDRSSPAIGAGSSVYAPVVDLEGNPRDESPDMGAYEWIP
jgi:hypothetical protein